MGLHHLLSLSVLVFPVSISNYKNTASPNNAGPPLSPVSPFGSVYNIVLPSGAGGGLLANLTNKKEK